MKNILLKTRAHSLVALASGICSIVSYQANAQLAANTYEFIPLSGTFTEIVGGTNIPAIQTDDAISAALPIGFTFNYCGTDYTQIKASSNGFITFNVANTSSANGNSSGNIVDIKPAVMPLWDDLGGGVGQANYLTSGTAPNRVFTLECKDWRWNYNSSFPATISFQVKLYESSNIIEFVYRRETGTGNITSSGGATIGIIDNNATAGYLVLNNATAAPVVSFTTLTTDIQARPLTGQIYRFKPIPAINLTIDTVIAASAFCSNAEEPLSFKVRNLGTSTINSFDVHWQVDGVTQPVFGYSATPIPGVGSAPNNTAVISLGNVFFPDATPRAIKVWTSAPNGVDDEVPDNDTITEYIRANLQGVNIAISPRDTTICVGSTITVDAGPFTLNPIYVWNTGALTRTIQVDDAGIYSVAVYNSDGCSDRDTISVDVYPNPVGHSIAVIDNGGGSFTFNIIGAQHVDTYTWDFGDGEGDTGPGSKTHTYDEPGQYTVTVTLKNECGEIVLTRLLTIEVTGISEHDLLQAAITLAPNPAKDFVNVSGKGDVKMKYLEVYNLVGQRIIRSEMNTSKYQLNISGLPSGLYNVVIGTEQGRVTKKIEIIK
jgi:chitodextrinase